MLALLLAFVVSLAVTLGVIHLVKTRGHFSLDHDVSGPQKFHARPVPRVGGIGIIAGLLSAVLAMHWTFPAGLALGLSLMACGIPCFAGGLIEDLTKRVSPRMRLMATAVSAVLAAVVMGSVITRADIPGIDAIVATSVGAMVVTVFAVTGIANSVNIVDGFNGLASMCAVIMLAALAYVAFEVGDVVLAQLCLAVMGAVLGFFLWNYPGGLIFLGDGGAYFLGFAVAELSILLLVRNPSVSPLFPLLVCIYPIFETLFSIYRRRFLRAVPPSMPDGIHLHSLIYRRVIRWAVGDRSAKAMTRRNSATSPFLWLLCMASVMPAVLVWNQSSLLAAFLLVFAITYVALYWRIVRFKSPRWMKYLASHPPRLHPRRR